MAKKLFNAMFLVLSVWYVYSAGKWIAALTTYAIHEGDRAVFDAAYFQFVISGCCMIFVLCVSAIEATTPDKEKTE